MNDLLVQQIDAILPQTQCQQCGFKGCKPYAQAISEHKADINQCPPGGEKGIQALSNLLGIPAKPLNDQFGKESPRLVAKIIEQDCIGCTKCLPPCPVDAIIGASKQMHTVIASFCTGCELCVAPCPVDCIVMLPVENPQWNKQQADLSRQRYQNKQSRLAKQALEKKQRIKRQRLGLAAIKKQPLTGNE